MQNRTILITGVTSGIGRATALVCAAQGARVMGCGRREEPGIELVEEIKRQGGEATFVTADVTREADVSRLVAAAETIYGGLDFAFNNAGIFVREPPLADYDDVLWDRQIAVGLTGTYRCMKHELRSMLKNTDGRHRAIINNASTVAHRGSVASGAGYTAVKHGILGLTRQAANEHADSNVRVNAVCPGPTLTEATAPLLAQNAAERKQSLSALNPTADLVRAEDIGAAVVFLCSDAARMINGHGLPLDGGQLARL